MSLTKKNRPIIILLLGLLSAIAPFSIDMYLPGFPAIADKLGTTVDTVSYSLASFFVGVCVGQLICGPLLDRYGRKRPLLLGIILYFVASMGCAISASIEMLILFRFLQALGGCVGMVAPRAIVRDLFPLEENAKVMSLLILVLGISPILAPTVGSFLIATLGWPSVFVVLAFIALLIALAVQAYLPESKQPDASFSLRFRPIMSSYGIVIRNTQFLTYALSGGISSAGLFAYLSGSPFVFMHYFKATEQGYGAIFAIIALGLISCSQANSVLLRRFTSQQMMRFALVTQCTIGAGLVLGTALDFLGMAGTIACILLFLCCQGFSFPNSAALSMAPFTREAGSASALMGSIQMGLGALSAAAVGMLNPTSPIPMVAVMCTCATCGLIVLSIGRKKIQKGLSTPTSPDGMTLA